MTHFANDSLPMSQCETMKKEAKEEEKKESSESEDEDMGFGLFD